MVERIVVVTAPDRVDGIARCAAGCRRRVAPSSRAATAGRSPSRPASRALERLGADATIGSSSSTTAPGRPPRPDLVAAVARGGRGARRRDPGRCRSPRRSSGSTATWSSGPSTAPASARPRRRRASGSGSSARRSRGSRPSGPRDLHRRGRPARGLYNSRSCGPRRTRPTSR